MLLRVQLGDIYNRTFDIGHFNLLCAQILKLSLSIPWTIIIILVLD